MPAINLWVWSDLVDRIPRKNAEVTLRWHPNPCGAKVLGQIKVHFAMLHGVLPLLKSLHRKVISHGQGRLWLVLVALQNDVTHGNHIIYIYDNIFSLQIGTLLLPLYDNYCTSTTPNDLQISTCGVLATMLRALLEQELLQLSFHLWGSMTVAQLKHAALQCDARYAMYCNVIIQWKTHGQPMENPWKKPLKEKMKIQWLPKHLRNCTIQLGHLRFQSCCWRGSGKLWRVFWELLGFPGRGDKLSFSAHLPKRITWQVLSGFNIQLSQAGPCLAPLRADLQESVPSPASLPGWQLHLNMIKTYWNHWSDLCRLDKQLHISSH